MQETGNKFEKVNLEPDVGFDIRFVTMKHNSPFHWHRELEILYILNGHATVNMEGKEYHVNPLDAIVMDFSKVHEVIYELPQTMGICIHISRQLLYRYLPNPELIEIHCSGETLTKEQQDAYARLCEILKNLTVLYVNQKKTYQLRSTAFILEILAILLESFSTPITKTVSENRIGNMERLEEICDFVEHHYQEEITLGEAAEEIGLNKEYFCRFFKQNTGTSFIRYVNEVRISHIYQDLLHSSEGILEITERHGFFNQKLFCRMFKEKYGCTPKQVRNIARDNPYM